jgi:hypothetical protein
MHLPCSYPFCSLVILYTDHISRQEMDKQNQIRGFLTASLLEDHEDELEEQSARCSDNTPIIYVSDTAPENEHGKWFSRIDFVAT